MNKTANENEAQPGMQASEAEAIASEMLGHRRRMRLLSWSQLLSVILVLAGALSSMLVEPAWLKLAGVFAAFTLGYPSVTQRLVFWLAGKGTR